MFGIVFRLILQIISEYQFYLDTPDLVALRGDPWYTDAVEYGIYTAITLVVVLIIKLIIRKKQS